MTGANVREAVPFFRVADMQASLKFYVDGLGFQLHQWWDPDGSIRWCSIRKDAAGLMLQDLRGEDGRVHPLESKPGVGVSVMFMCDDALAIYHEAKARGLTPRRPFVGNGMWVTSFVDPDGYCVEFESATDAPEESEYDG